MIYCTVTCALPDASSSPSPFRSTPPSPDHTLLHQPNFSTSCRLVTSNRSIAFELPTQPIVHVRLPRVGGIISLLFYKLRGYIIALTVYRTAREGVNRTVVHTRREREGCLKKGVWRLHPRYVTMTNSDKSRRFDRNDSVLSLVIDSIQA